MYFVEITIQWLDIVYPNTEYQFHKQSFRIKSKTWVEKLLRDYLP